VAMTQWEDHSDEDGVRILHYLAGRDPWTTTKKELWLAIVGAALFVAQISTVVAALLRALR